MSQGKPAPEVEVNTGDSAVFVKIRALYFGAASVSFDIRQRTVVY